MTKIRQLPFNERLDIYHKHRIIEQRDWYIKKSKSNKKYSNLFFCLLIIISVILSILIFFDFSNTENDFILPVSILLSVISVLFTWVQTKKYKELEKSYALTSHEINFITTQKDDIKQSVYYIKHTLQAPVAAERLKGDSKRSYKIIKDTPFIYPVVPNDYLELTYTSHIIQYLASNIGNIVVFQFSMLPLLQILSSQYLGNATNPCPVL